MAPGKNQIGAKGKPSLRNEHSSLATPMDAPARRDTPGRIAALLYLGAACAVGFLVWTVFQPAGSDPIGTRRPELDALIDPQGRLGLAMAASGLDVVTLTSGTCPEVHTEHCHSEATVARYFPSDGRYRIRHLTMDDGRMPYSVASSVVRARDATGAAKLMVYVAGDSSAGEPKAVALEIGARATTVAERVFGMSEDEARQADAWFSDARSR